jgi:hypothetical protein
MVLLGVPRQGSQRYRLPLSFTLVGEEKVIPSASCRSSCKKVPLAEAPNTEQTRAQKRTVIMVVHKSIPAADRHRAVGLAVDGENDAGCVLRFPGRCGARSSECARKDQHTRCLGVAESGTG